MVGNAVNGNGQFDGGYGISSHSQSDSTYTDDTKLIENH